MNSQACSHRRSARSGPLAAAVLCLFYLLLLAGAGPAFAIPSPELVIGSVSALGQIFAVVFAGVGSFGAVLASRLGFQRKINGKNAPYPKRLVTLLICVGLLLLGANIWQWTTARTAETARLQATLLRPAQFTGTEIKDQSLKETSFASQTRHPQAVTTQDAARLLASGGAKFFDIRETAEHEMGTLPGARHMRFPDFRQSVPVAPGESVVLFCHNGNRSSETCAELAALGIDCRFVAGGIEKWIVEGRPFSDHSVTSLSDLRAIPDYPGKETLLTTKAFTRLAAKGDLQVIDTRYPGDFATGHLPGAVNIPIRALTSQDLAARITALRKTPTIVACYDRRSCFMGQVLGRELTRAGIPFEGRYTLPWEFFIPPAPKPHVAAWLADQNQSLWQKTFGPLQERGVAALAAVLVRLSDHAHLLWGLLGLALASRLLILPLSVKSERDQITQRRHRAELDQIKADLKQDPTRKARALREFYARHNITPLRNLAALLALPLMMLGLASAERAAQSTVTGLLWLKDLGAPDPSHLSPALACALAGVYIWLALGRGLRQKLLIAAIALPLLGYLLLPLTAAGNLYLAISLSLMLLQRGWIMSALTEALTGGPSAARAEGLSGRIARLRLQLSARRLPRHVSALAHPERLRTAGNKALRLARMRAAGLPVPDGLVLHTRCLESFARMQPHQRDAFALEIWNRLGPGPLAVRSSARDEDGADQSFAGIFDSVLDVRASGLCEAISTVSASFGSAHAATYGGAQPGQSAPHQGNILLQQMVDAHYAGVLFTKDPSHPLLSLLEYVEGCGEALVSGEVTPTTLRFGRASGDLMTDAPTQLPFDASALMALGQQIETLFEGPQDIEWAWRDGQFYILQSRDITATAQNVPDHDTENDTAGEWQAIADRFAAQSATGHQTGPQTGPDDILLEQDEMSELLPRATPLSFSLMARLWAPGGSLDLASRALGLPYGLPESAGRQAHLVQLFGTTYVDRRLKSRLAMTLSPGQTRRMRRTLAPGINRYRQEVLPRLRDRLDLWRASDFAALPLDKLHQATRRLFDEFAFDFYTEAERVNLLAAFAMGEAQTGCAGDPALRSHLMQADLPHAPANLLARCRGATAAQQALAKMGHRALFDYELSSPRYREAPALLAPLLDAGALPLPEAEPPRNLPADLARQIDLAVAYQDLKEQAKHESLALYAELRRALLALGDQLELGELIFWLTLEEIERLDTGGLDSKNLPAAQIAILQPLRQRAQRRRADEQHSRRPHTLPARLSLRDCEALSLGLKGRRGTQSKMSQGPQGSCVAGAGQASGRIFRIHDESLPPAEAFKGFEPGDILICRMVHPAWLAQIQEAGAVLSEVGGWLSHMAIVARERRILMLVACQHIEALKTGDHATVRDTGEITVTPAPSASRTDQAQSA